MEHFLETWWRESEVTSLVQCVHDACRAGFLHINRHGDDHSEAPATESCTSHGLAKLVRSSFCSPDGALSDGPRLVSQWLSRRLARVFPADLRRHSFTTQVKAHLIHVWRHAPPKML